MLAEVKRIKFLFATFALGYILRAIFQVGVVLHIYKEMIPHMITRWYLISTLPLIWEIPSILSILILHYISFNSINKIPAAGHLRRDSSKLTEMGMPDFDTMTY